MKPKLRKQGKKIKKNDWRNDLEMWQREEFVRNMTKKD